MYSSSSQPASHPLLTSTFSHLICVHAFLCGGSLASASDIDLSKASLAKFALDKVYGGASHLTLHGIEFVRGLASVSRSRQAVATAVKQGLLSPAVELCWPLLPWRRLNRCQPSPIDHLPSLHPWVVPSVWPGTGRRPGPTRPMPTA